MDLSVEDFEDDLTEDLVDSGAGGCPAMMARSMAKRALCWWTSPVRMDFRVLNLWDLSCFAGI